MTNKKKFYKPRNNFKTIRKNIGKKGLTQKEIALLLYEKYDINVTPQYIGAIERGERNPSLDLAFAIAQLFNSTTEYLFKKF